MPSKRAVAILGSTGSIGINTLDVIRLHPDRFEVFALSANTSVDTLFDQCIEFKPRYAAMASARHAGELSSRLRSVGLEIEVLDGEGANAELAAHAQVDTMVAGIVGAIGLLPTLAAVKQGKTVLIANKEPLVMLGSEIMQLARENDATVVPVDSEHNAIFSVHAGRRIAGYGSMWHREDSADRLRRSIS